MHKEISGFIKEVKDYYIIHDNGIVYSTASNKELKVHDCNGYLRCYLVGTDGKNKPFFVHRLVAMAFLDKIEGKDFINHKDGNKYNNALSNLEWVTPSENMRHADKTGLRQVARGEKVAGAKLKEEDIKKIFEY